MARLVRCIDGHVFDAEVTTQCPICGATIDLPQAAAVQQPTDKATVPAVSLSRRPFLTMIGGAGVGVAATIVGAVWLFHSHTPAPSQPTAVESTTKRSQPPNSVVSSQAPGQISRQTADLPPNAEPPLSDALKSALSIAQMNVAAQRGDYASVRDVAQMLAARNNPIGLFQLGELLQSGLGGEKDLVRSRALFVSAYKLGFPPSALALGGMLEHGLGGPIDVEEAKRLYLFAAVNGVPAASDELRRLRIENRVGNVNEAFDKLIKGQTDARALALLQQMAEAPSTPARCLTGWLYLTGKSVAVDHRRALDLFQIGTAQDNSLCEWGMGMIASTGIPEFPRNDVEAATLLRLSVRSVTVNNPLVNQIEHEITVVEGRMTDDEKAKVQALLREAPQSAPVVTAQSSKRFSVQAWRAAPRSSAEWSRVAAAKQFLDETKIEGMPRSQVVGLLGEPGYSGFEYSPNPIGGSDVYRLDAKSKDVLEIVYGPDGKATRGTVDDGGCYCDPCNEQAPPLPEDVVINNVVKKPPAKADGQTLSIDEFEALIGRGGRRSVEFQPAAPEDPNAFSSNQPDPRRNTTARSIYDVVWRIVGGAPHRFLDASGGQVGGPLDESRLGQRPLASYTIITMQPDCLSP